MKSFKTFLFEEKEEPRELKSVDFRDKEEATPLETVDFRSGKDQKESVNEEVQDQSWTDYATGAKHKKEVESHDKKLSKLAKDEYVPAAVKSYTRGSKTLNSRLFKSKGKVAPTLTDKVKDIDEHLGTSPASHNFDVYSGLHFEPKPGLHVHHGYMSSSLSRLTASTFAHTNTTLEPNTPYKSVRHILRMTIPKGSKHGAYIAPHSEFKGEREFLVGRGKKIRIHPDPKIFIRSPGNEIHVHTGTFED